jgi:hypothetical protein
MREGGFLVLEGPLDDQLHRLMLREAITASAAAHPTNVLQSDGEEIRGGSPARRFLSAAGAEVQSAFYHSPRMLRLLHELSGARVVPSGDLGTYTYYARTGDHLTIHRDVESCDVAVITCLSDTPEAVGRGGRLCLYPERLFEPLSVIRATPDQGALGLRLAAGQTIVMFGGIVPHAILPVVEGQVRIVSVLCYCF